MTANSVLTHRNVGVVAVNAVEAPEIITSPPITLSVPPMVAAGSQAPVTLSKINFDGHPGSVAAPTVAVPTPKYISTVCALAGRIPATRTNKSRKKSGNARPMIFDKQGLLSAGIRPRRGFTTKIDDATDGGVVPAAWSRVPIMQHAHLRSGELMRYLSRKIESWCKFL